MHLYSTGQGPNAGSGSENSAVVSKVPAAVLLAAARNFDTTNAKTVMLFDATSVPGDGTPPVLAVDIGAAPSATQAADSSIALPSGGVMFTKGVVICLSKTAKFLTLDTGGPNGFFQVHVGEG